MCNLGNILLIFISASAISFSCSNAAQSGKVEPWTIAQLMDPENLAKTLNNPASKQPVIFSIGPSGLIKNAIDIGPAKDNENLKKLKSSLNKLSKDADIVLYCGCCPFADCPNVRPAFKLLNEMKFTNHQLLNLSQNLKVDWIDKGYPMEK